MSKKSKKHLVIGTKILASLCYFAVVAYAIYYVMLVATDRYITSAQFSITKDEKAQQTGLLESLGFAPSSGSADTQLAVGYIESVNLLTDVDKEFNLASHYSDEKNDSWYRLDEDASIEGKLEHYRERITANFDESTGLVEIKVESYDPKFSLTVCHFILKKSEQYINDLNYTIAQERFKLVQGELDSAGSDLAKHKAEVRKAVQVFEFLSPDADIAARYSHLNELKSTIIRLQAQIPISKDADKPALSRQIEEYKKQLQDAYTQLTGSEKDDYNKKLANLREKEYLVTRAQEIFDNTLIMHNQTRLESVAKSRFFSKVQDPYLPEEALRPRRYYISATIAVLAFLLFIILRILINSVLSH